MASVCKKKTIQFNNKWKSADLKLTVQSKYVCTEVLLQIFFIFFIFIFLI